MIWLVNALQIVFDIDPQDFPAVELCTTVQLIYYEHGKLYPIYAITEHFLPRFFFCCIMDAQSSIESSFNSNLLDVVYYRQSYY